MLSYHNDPAVKIRHVALARHHRDADMLRAGLYSRYDPYRNPDKMFQGCSIGCMVHDIYSFARVECDTRSPPEIYAEAAGWPEWLAHWNDVVFEGLPDEDRSNFHVDLRERDWLLSILRTL